MAAAGGESGIAGRRVCWPEARRAVVEPFEPGAPGPGQVLIAAEWTLISPGTERAFFLGLPNAAARFPSYPGYSCVGRVLAAGDGVDDPVPGDRVATPARHASHSVMAADRCWKVPDGLDPESAVYFYLAAIALQGVRKARVELGEPVAVLGLGLIGIMALQLARLQGGLPAVGLDPDPGRRQVAGAVGADACLDPAGEGFESAFAAQCPGGPAVVIEATGAPEAVNDALRLAAEHGRVVLLASTRGETAANFYRDIHCRGITVLGAHNAARPAVESSPGYWTAADDARTALRLLAAGRLQVGPLTSEVLPADDAARAYEWLASWRKDLLGILLRWDGSGPQPLQPEGPRRIPKQ